MLQRLNAELTHLMFDGGHLTVMGMKDGPVDDLLVVLLIGISAGEDRGELSNDTAATMAALVKELMVWVLLHGLGNIKPCSSDSSRSKLRTVGCQTLSALGFVRMV